MNLSSLFGQAESAVTNEVHSISSVGAPALVSGLESYGAQILTGLSQSSAQAATQAANSAIQSGGPSSPLGEAIAKAFGDVTQNAVLKNYGVYILGGIAVIAGAAYFMARE